ncbi:unnamed protein product [Parascedosporium putredinis]|uniref:Polyketide cyclase n=1 Tax=Parascedosporium putredinis TaxID=1442378 RepID=A0A9P1GXD4_9PEZI|nr:unnamed protein product [Parascedosporium putredinis]CAI7989588.1 unnamed protein product [Parascedosporium putredinis]
MFTHISWPRQYLPGTTDNFVSNEVYVRGITAEQVWKYLTDVSHWELHKWDKFRFSTFGFPPLNAEVWDCVEPTDITPGHIAWRAWQEGDDSSALDVYHAWVVENVDWGVVRICTQESQNGQPAAKLAQQKPNPMLNGHQDWLNGLVAYTKSKAKSSA